MAFNVKLFFTLLKNYLLRLLSIVGVTLIISYIISYFFDFNVGTTLFVLGLIFMVMGLQGVTNKPRRSVKLDDKIPSGSYVFLSAPAGIILFIIGLFLSD